VVWALAFVCERQLAKAKALIVCKVGQLRHRPSQMGELKAQSMRPAYIAKATASMLCTGTDVSLA
jgi:hypothetical protein